MKNPISDQGLLSNQRHITTVAVPLRSDSPVRTFLRYLTRAILTVVILAVLVLTAFRLNAWWQESQTADTLAPSDGMIIETSLGKMHASTWGDRKGTPVVMTHGMAAWGGLWEETARHLANHGYWVIAIDQPPFGFSERSDDNFSRSRQAGRLNALTEAMQLKRFVLVGHSYGGGIAAEAALRYPANVRALVLICPVIGLAKPGETPASLPIPLPLRMTALAETLVAATITNPLMTGFLTRLFMHKKDALTGRHIEILQRPMKLQGNTANMVAWLEQFLATDPTALSRDRVQLAKLSVPLSFIWGEKDTVTPIEQGNELSTILNPLSFTRLPNIGHMPQLEDPELFNRHILQTLEALK